MLRAAKHDYMCGEERNDPILENDPVLIFRLVWKIQKTEPVKNNVTCEYIEPEVLVNSKIISKIIP